MILEFKVQIGFFADARRMGSCGQSGHDLDWRYRLAGAVSGLTQLSRDNAIWKQDLACFDAQIDELGEK
jgi:hypothetical protein